MRFTSEEINLLKFDLSETDISAFLILGAKAVAALSGRTTPSIADVQNIVKPILRHRIITNFNAEAENISTDNVLEKLIDTLPVN